MCDWSAAVIININFLDIFIFKHTISTISEKFSVGDIKWVQIDKIVFAIGYANSGMAWFAWGRISRIIYVKKHVIKLVGFDLIWHLILSKASEC